MGSPLPLPALFCVLLAGAAARSVDENLASLEADLTKLVEAQDVAPQAVQSLEEEKSYPIYIEAPPKGLRVNVKRGKDVNAQSYQLTFFDSEHESSGAKFIGPMGNRHLALGTTIGLPVKVTSADRPISHDGKPPVSAWLYWGAEEIAAISISFTVESQTSNTNIRYTGGRVNLPGKVKRISGNEIRFVANPDRASFRPNGGGQALIMENDHHEPMVTIRGGDKSRTLEIMVDDDADLQTALAGQKKKKWYQKLLKPFG